VFTEDLTAFYDPLNGFASAAVYDAAGANTALNVIFDEPHLEMVDIGGTNPVARARAVDIPATGWKGKTLTVGAASFTIEARQPIDDGAEVLLQLQRS